MKLGLNESTGEVRDETGATFCYIAQSGYRNADFIVRACNTHDELVSALEWAVRCWEVGAWKNEDGQTPDIKPILDALTKARGNI